MENSKLENWLQSKSNIIFTLLLATYVIFSFLYFNIKPSIAGDDSAYIISAINFIDIGRFPSYQGPLYPIFLSLIIAVTGMNLVILKLTSTLFMMGFAVIFYRSFKNRVSYTSLFFTLGILSVSHLFLFFSSQTYSEAFFIFLQSILFYVLFRNIEDKDTENSRTPSKKELTYALLVSGLCTSLFLTRTIGFGATLAVVVFYIFQKNYKRAIYITALFALMVSLFFMVRTMAWDVPLKSGKQTSQLLNKNPYDANDGQEDFKGFLTRFKDNSNLYLSKHLMRIVGVRDQSINSIKPWITILLYLVFIAGFFIHYKKNKYLLFIGLYVAVMLGITFFSLQQLWDQYRLIIPYVPFILIFLVESVIKYAKAQNLKFAKTALPLFLGISIALTFSKGTKTIDLDTLSKNIRGDKLAGYTPDWVSYLKMAEYCNKNLSKENYVACRKPNMARIYGKGKKFHGIYRIPSNNPEELVQYLKEKNISHIMMASLRKNPYVFTGRTINTVQRFMAIVVKQYPQAFKLVKKYGKQEPAYLFEIDYSAFVPAQNN